MAVINEIQLILQNILKRTISQAEIGKALGTGRANINLRIKNKSEIKLDEIKKIETYFGVHLTEHLNADLAAGASDTGRFSSSLFYNELMDIINSADESELEFYFGILNQCRRGIDLLRKRV